jgi:hypothetical protein
MSDSLEIKLLFHVPEGKTTSKKIKERQRKLRQDLFLQKNRS